MSREHGTKACYVFGPEPGGDSSKGCRCSECRASIALYERERARRTEPPYVSAGPARAHLAWLAEQGIGLKSVSRITGLSTGTLGKIVYGIPSIGRPPSRRIRPATAEKILAVKPADASGGTRVPAEPVRAMIERLAAAGVPKARIAERCGLRGPGLQVARPGTRQVLRCHAEAIGSMVEELDAGTLEVVRYSRYGAHPVDTGIEPQPVELRSVDDDLVLALAEALEARIDQSTWRKDAACRGRPVWMFFPARGDVKTSAAAKAVCRACIVRRQCLAANFDEPFGFVGGLSARERQLLRRRDRMSA